MNIEHCAGQKGFSLAVEETWLYQNVEKETEE